MTVSSILQAALEEHERETVSDAFGGTPSNGRTPNFSVSHLATIAKNSFSQFPDDFCSKQFQSLADCMSEEASWYLLQSAIRYAFLIELTNLKISSTKMKTRWVPAYVTKVAPGTFTNIRGVFNEKDDQRGSSFQQCFQIFSDLLSTLTSPNLEQYRAAIIALSKSRARGFPYEFVFTYQNPALPQSHVSSNLRLAKLDDLLWLIKARPIFGNILSESSFKKISVKSYLTDRSQTGADQTNRAKRWEVLSADFQHATLEECWSVQRKLFESLPGFANFPEAHLKALQEESLIDRVIPMARCPITLEHLDFNSFQETTDHGQSAHQVGHLKPLKSGGRHTGSNVAWVTDHGNRIQGDNDIDTTRTMLIHIFGRMVSLGIASSYSN